MRLGVPSLERSLHLVGHVTSTVPSLRAACRPYCLAVRSCPRVGLALGAPARRLNTAPLPATDVGGAASKRPASRFAGAVWIAPRVSRGWTIRRTSISTEAQQDFLSSPACERLQIREADRAGLDALLSVRYLRRYFLDFAGALDPPLLLLSWKDSCSPTRRRGSPESRQVGHVLGPQGRGSA